jgi:hypothetical protein
MHRESWSLQRAEGERFRPSGNIPSTARTDSSRAMRAKFRPAVRRTILLLCLTLCFLASLRPYFLLPAFVPVREGAAGEAAIREERQFVKNGGLQFGCLRAGSIPF